MPTLQELRKRKYKTITEFAKVWGTSASTASQLLRGMQHRTLSRDDVTRLATLLDVSFDECVEAENASHKDYFGVDRSYQSLQELWQQRETWARAAFKGVKFDKSYGNSAKRGQELHSRA